jgi:hypothetical protein
MIALQYFAVSLSFQEAPSMTSDPEITPAAGNEDRPAFIGAQIQELKDVLVGELRENGDWIVANVETNSFWPVNAQKQLFHGQTIWILPITHKHYPAVAMNRPASLERTDCEKLLMRFLSTLSWITEHEMSVVHGIGGGNLPRPLGRDRTMGFSITEEFDLSYFPEPADKKALLALALMREGRGLNHPGYAFLAFYRVLEVAFPDGLARGAWISGRVMALADFRAREAVTKLTARGVGNIGVHLRDSGRRAMAHAREEPIIDPDDPADARRLFEELPIMVSLATLAIEEVFGVETRHTVYRMHLYELVGFKAILGEDVVTRLLAGESFSEDATIDLPNINVRLRRHAPFTPLEKLIPVEAGRDGSLLFVRYHSADGTVEIQMGLDFDAERLEFDMFRDITCKDAGTANGAQTMLDIRTFLNALFCNGQLEIYDSDSGDLLSRKDAYMPMNMMFNDKAARAEIEQIQAIIEQRRKAELTNN